MTRPLQVIEGEPRSPRVFVALAQPEGPANQVYLKLQPDGGVLFYMASSLDRPLQEIFDFYAYNGYMTDTYFIKMCVDNKLFPADKNPDPLKHIFKTVAKEERCVEYEAFLRLLHLLSRLKFRKANLPEQDAVNAVVAHLLQMAPRRQRRHRLVNCGVQATPEYADKACDVRTECKDAAVDCEPRLQDQIIQEQIKTNEAGVAAVVETRDAGEQAELFESKHASVQVDIQKEIDEEEKKKKEEERAKQEEEDRRRQEEEERRKKEEEEERRRREEEEKRKKEEEERRKKEEEEAAAKARREQFKDMQTQTVYSGEDAIKLAESSHQPEVLTALRGEQDSLLYRAFCLYSEFVPEACENLLSEVNCALMFRDGDLMAVPLHPAIRGLPPSLAREYFNTIVSRRKSGEPMTAEKDASAAAEAPGVSTAAAQPASEPRLNYREFKAVSAPALHLECIDSCMQLRAVNGRSELFTFMCLCVLLQLVFLASQWICQTQNSYWSFVRIVRDTLLPGLFRAQPWQQQASVELQGLAFRAKHVESSTSSETPEVETTEQTATSYSSSSSSSSSSSESEGSTSSSSTDQNSSSSSSQDARSRRTAGARLSRRVPAGRGGDGGRRDKVFGGYDDEQPIGMDTVFYEEAQSAEESVESEDSSSTSSLSRDQQRRGPPPPAGGAPLSTARLTHPGAPWMGAPAPPFEPPQRRELMPSNHGGCRLVRR
ncbi:hypothetical protein Emed_006609 [Eimeria media]